MRFILAYPKLDKGVRSDEPVEFTLIRESECETSLHANDCLLGFDIAGDDVNEKELVWELFRVRSNLNRREANLPKNPDESLYIFHLTSRGPKANWSLVPGHYALRISNQEKIVCNTTFSIPYTKQESGLENLENLLDRLKLVGPYRDFLIDSSADILGELEAFAKSEFGDTYAKPKITESIFHIAVQSVKDKISSEDGQVETFAKTTLDACKDAMVAQVRVLSLLEDVHQLTRDRPYSDNETQALVNLLIRGTNLESYDQYGIMQVIINNAKRLQIDQQIHDSTPAAAMRREDDLQRQREGYQGSTDPTFDLPDESSDQFDDRFDQLTAGQKKKIIPKLVVSSYNVNTKEERSEIVFLEQTWTIGRQTSEERRRLGDWNGPLLDFENNKVIIAGHFHNTFSKEHLTLVPTYRHAKYMDLGRTVAIRNPSNNYSIRLSDDIFIGPESSYATAKHLYFVYPVSKNNIQVPRDSEQAAKITDKMNSFEFVVRIDIFFESMKRGDVNEVLMAMHEWIGRSKSDSDSGSSSSFTFSQTVPPRPQE